MNYIVSNTEVSWTMG